MHARVLGLIVASLLGIWLMVAPGRAAKENVGAWQPILDEAAARELIARTVKAIQEEVGTSKKDAKAIRKSNKKVQVAAVMLAAVAQSAKAGPDKQLLATYREAALKLAQAAAQGNPGNIKKLADALTDLKADAGAKPAPISLKSYLEDAGDVMQPFRRLALGGDGLPPVLQSTGPLKTMNGIEEKLRVLVRRAPKKDQLDKEAAELVVMAHKIAVGAQAAYEWAPAQKEGNKDPKDWQEWAVEMRAAALKLAAAAKKKNPAEVLAASKTLNANCTKCHGIFKTTN
jgi:cytochrome c556